MEKEMVIKIIEAEFGHALSSFAEKLVNDVCNGLQEISKESVFFDGEKFNVNNMSFNPCFLHLVIARELRSILSPYEVEFLRKNDDKIRKVNEADNLDEAMKLFNVLQNVDDIEEIISIQEKGESLFWWSQSIKTVQGKDVISEAQEMTNYYQNNA